MILVPSIGTLPVHLISRLFRSHLRPHWTAWLIRRTRQTGRAGIPLRPRPSSLWSLTAELRLFSKRCACCRRRASKSGRGTTQTPKCEDFSPQLLVTFWRLAFFCFIISFLFVCASMIGLSACFPSSLRNNTVLSRYVESLFAFTRELCPWGNFSGNVENQSIKRRLSL